MNGRAEAADAGRKSSTTKASLQHRAYSRQRQWRTTILWRLPLFNRLLLLLFTRTGLCGEFIPFVRSRKAYIKRMPLSHCPSIISYSESINSVLFLQSFGKATHLPGNISTQTLSEICSIWRLLRPTWQSNRKEEEAGQVSMPSIKVFT